MGANQPAPVQPVLGAALDPAAFVGMQMGVVRSETARLDAGMPGNGLAPMVEDADHTRLAPDPNLAALAGMVGSTTVP